MKIYYAASIRGNHEFDNREINRKIISYLQKAGHAVLTEHLLKESIKGIGETNLTDKQVHDRDMNWVKQSDVIIAEVTNPSLGVGYELGRALEMGKNILCLYRNPHARLSAMIRGSERITAADYNTAEEAIRTINEFLNLL